MSNFNVEHVTENAISWIKRWFDRNGKNMNVVIGMSGGKDSTVTAALLCKALGPERVYGIALPQGDQGINEADEICKYFGMDYTCINIGKACDEIVKSLHDVLDISNNTVLNIPARVRMTTLYGFAQSLPGGAFVVNNCNLSEDYIGYATKFGDGAGDFSVLSNLTVTEIIAIGDYLGIPSKWVHKKPDDGLPHSCPDEEKFGFSYEVLDKYIRNECTPEGYVHNNESEGKIVDKIISMHRSNLHKITPMPVFYPNA